MRDGQGREIDYMRISITDRCNLRCRYCMPEGVECMPRWDILSLEEIKAIAICAASLGIRHIKVTGGEPLVRRDCCQLVAMLKSVPGIEKVTITTNGVLLDQYLEPLLAAGIDGINISLDTLDPVLYKEITGRDELGNVLGVLKKASSLPVRIKVNAVSVDFRSLLPEGAGQEPAWKKLAELAREYPVDVRFIEMMPIGYGKQFTTIDHQELLREMKFLYPDMEEDPTPHGFGPAVYYRIPGWKGSLGLISAIHGKFCGSCNRVRLTAQGYMKSCLCYEDGVDLRNILRNGEQRPDTEGHYHWPLKDCPEEPALQERLREAMSGAIFKKPGAHCFEKPGQITESHNMIAIGG